MRSVLSWFGLVLVALEAIQGLGAFKEPQKVSSFQGRGSSAFSGENSNSNFRQRYRITEDFWARTTPDPDSIQTHHYQKPDSFKFPKKLGLTQFKLKPKVDDKDDEAKLCPRGWIHFQSSCYLFSSDFAKSWDDARAVCQAFRHKYKVL